MTADILHAEPAGPGERRAPLIEILGPATAGKTSLVRALRSRDPRIRSGLGVGRSRWLPVLLRRVAVLFPMWLARYRGDRWFTWNELKSIAFLESWLRAARDPAPVGTTVTVLDHGPVYRLARLREFGPEIARSQRFERWRRACLEGWLSALDLVVALDAPDAVLLRRVEERGHWYLSGDRSSEEKREFFARYRRAFEDALRTPVADPPSLIRIRSDQRSPDEIADQALAAVRPPILVPAAPEVRDA